jgi:uncharacterized RDD family membrane protein YckC
MVYAGFWRRFAAMILDFLFLLIPNVALFWVMPTLGSTLLALVYFPIFESSPLQATPGKYCFGLKVVRANGERLSFARALARYLLKIPSGVFLLLGYLIQPFTEKRQAFHDLVSDSVVIKHPFSAPVDWFGLWWNQVRYVCRADEVPPADRPDGYRPGAPIADSPGSSVASAAKEEGPGLEVHRQAVEALEKLHDLYRNGILTEDEFLAKKAELLKKV